MHQARPNPESLHRKFQHLHRFRNCHFPSLVHSSAEDPEGKEMAHSHDLVARLHVRADCYLKDCVRRVSFQVTDSVPEPAVSVLPGYSSSMLSMTGSRTLSVSLHGSRPAFDHNIASHDFSAMICADRRDRVPGIHTVPPTHGAKPRCHLRSCALTANLLRPPRTQQSLGLQLLQEVQPELRSTLGRLERAPRPQAQADPRHGIRVRNGRRRAQVRRQRGCGGDWRRRFPGR